MELLLARLSQLEDQVTSLPKLPSVVEAQASTLTRLSSENIALRTEVAQVRRETQDQELVIGKLSRTAIPGGFWIWESRRDQGREEEGRWLWSLHEHLALYLVFFGLLELAPKHVYGPSIDLDPDQAYDFVESRVFHPALKTERITSLLLPREVRIFGSPVINAFKDLVDLASSLSSHPASVRVKILIVYTLKLEDLVLWMDLLPFLNPVTFQLWMGDDDDDVERPPTIRFVPANFVDSFASGWSQLREFWALGPESVLLVEGTERTSVFEACLRRCSPDLPRVRVRLYLRTSAGAETRKTVRERELSHFLQTLKVSEGCFDLVSLHFGMMTA